MSLRKKLKFWLECDIRFSRSKIDCFKDVVLFMGICSSSPTYCIVTEYMQRGSLFDVIHNDKINLKAQIVLTMLSDILKGLQFIHSAGIIHRDLKSPNLLVDRNWTIKIADFGLSCTKAEAASDARISLLWTAPEVLLDQKGCYTDKSDIYSFGIVVWELMARKIPFEGVAVAAISPAVVSNQRPPIPTDWPTGIASLITSCWHNRPGTRPTVKEVRGTVDALTLTYDFETSSGPPVEPNASFAPPSGHVTFVCSTIQQLYQPWSDDPWCTAKAIALLNTRVLELLIADNGHEVRNDGVSFLFAFSACSDAFSFCLRAQTEIMQVAWPESILKFEETQEVSNASGEILFRGLSLRMGIHTTSAVADKDLATGAINYLGKGINLASKLAGLAKRGQILIGADSFSRLGGTSQNMPQYYMESLGSNALETELSTICLILPFKLKGRLWDQPELQFPPPPEALPSTPSLNPAAPQRISKHFNTPSFYNQTSASLITSPTSLLPNTSRSTSASTMRLVFTGTSTAKATGSGSDEGRDPFEFPPAGNKWMIDEKDLKGGVLLDKSSQPWEVFSSVLRGGDKVLVEKFSNQKTYDGMLLEMRAEIAALRRLQHPNVAKYYGLCLTSQYLCLVTEFSFLQNPDNYNLPWEKKFSWAVDIAKGMWYLHSNGIIHTDLKSANVVFTTEGVLKIVDYGFNRIKTDTQAMTQTGTVGYVAPEVFQGNSYTVHTDVYSYGIILWELIYQVSPWAGEHSMHIVYKVTSSGRPSVKNMPSHTPSVNPVLRPGFVDIIAELDPKVLSDM